MSERCFAMKQNGKCRALEQACPGHAACAFFKTNRQQEEDQQRAYKRLAELPFAQQQDISKKYYGGLMPWEGV